MAQATFTNLKTLFSSAPLRIHSDPELQFIMELNTLDSGVGAVLSQQEAPPLWNRELLVVILALQEWRNWLEGAAHPFVIWSDYKNLTYIRSACRPCF